MATIAQSASTPARVLIYSATADFRHDSIPTARDALIAQGSTANIQFDATEDQGTFTDDGLSVYDALVFLMNTGEGKSTRSMKANGDAFVLTSTSDVTVYVSSPRRER